MSGSVTGARYGRATIALHWVMLLLLAAVFATIEMRVLFERGSETREFVKALHFMLGLSVLIFVALRIAARVVGGTPAISPRPPFWQTAAAHAVHGALYLFMIAMPIAGWVILSAAGEPIPFFGMELPPIVLPNEALSEQVEEIHETAGEVAYYVIGLHAAAALFHHYVMRDDTLLRMLPGRR
ncbi:cytochrome b [Sphingosinicella soli]|uniref:Cytochrome b561 n=1 Tax=Sphingosinicella soli TaxID=333708 RepID=A0A7W7B1S6_9SPHN|nr:cytochrome b [Sphingosinicella soli]MBB4632443.1 cytochrome b561 [Sphingosinicella soli]